MTEANAERKQSMLFNYVFFVFVIAVWLAFGYAAVTSAGSLDALWTSIRALPLIVQLAMWALLLPWMIALWIWESGWAAWLRILLVLGLAWVTIMITLPRAAS